jgi:hypothetical protein
MGGKSDPESQVRKLYPVKEGTEFHGLREDMLGPAADVARIAGQAGVPFMVTSGVRHGESSAHGEGFALDWIVPEDFGPALQKEMNDRWGPKGFYFSFHPDRIGTDENGKPIFDPKKKHLHGQRKIAQYQQVLRREKKMQRTQGQKRRGPVDPAELQPEAATRDSLFAGMTSNPALRPSIKTEHLNERVAVVPRVLPDLEGGQGLVVDSARRAENSAAANNRVMQRALRAAGRKTLVGGN